MKWNKIQRINESWFFEEWIKIHKPLAKLTNRKQVKTQTGDEKGAITTDTNKLQKIIVYYL